MLKLNQKEFVLENFILLSSKFDASNVVLLADVVVLVSTVVLSLFFVHI